MESNWKTNYPNIQTSSSHCTYFGYKTACCPHYVSNGKDQAELTRLKWPMTSLIQLMCRDHTLSLSEALKNQGTETTSILILKRREGSILTRTCRCRLLNKDNTSSIFHRWTNGWRWGWRVMVNSACKQERAKCFRMGVCNNGGCWRPNENLTLMCDGDYKSWVWDFSHLFEPLHVFEVESDVKKAEIRIYKLKLQERGGCLDNILLNNMGSCNIMWGEKHLLEPFW